MVLHYYVGMPLTDVAATLAIPVGTVKSRLHRALTEMRVAIDADFDHGHGSDLRRAAGMTTELRLTTELPEILGELAMGPYPEYIDDVLATTAEVRQRSAWTFPERWLPMVDATRRPALVPGFPWRSFSTAMLLLALLLAAVAIYLGSQQRVPPPFGPARNGLIAYAEGGDIYHGRSRDADGNRHRVRPGGRRWSALFAGRHACCLRAEGQQRRRVADLSSLAPTGATSQS